MQLYAQYKESYYIIKSQVITHSRMDAIFLRKLKRKSTEVASLPNVT